MIQVSWLPVGDAEGDPFIVREFISSEIPVQEGGLGIFFAETGTPNAPIN